MGRRPSRLSELYGNEAVARALVDAFAYQSLSCEYIANSLHLTRQQGQLGWDLLAGPLTLR